jgi:AcrR family transcriptional regulator
MGQSLRDPGESRSRFASGGAAPLITAVAHGIIEEHGLAGLSFREVAKELGITRGTPLYHFGTIAGLVGAVAADAFSELAELLELKRRSSAPAERILNMAAQHVWFALKHANLYLAIHSPELWTAAAGHDEPKPARQKPPGNEAKAKAQRWIDDAVAARDRAFASYDSAVQELIGSGQIRGSQDATDIARMITALIDGYVFQLANEQVGAKASAAEQRDYGVLLVRLALEGVTISGEGARGRGP